MIGSCIPARSTRGRSDHIGQGTLENRLGIGQTASGWKGSHRELLAERAETVARLRRLGPAWGEVRSVLNQINTVLAGFSG